MEPLSRHKIFTVGRLLHRRQGTMVMAKWARTATHRQQALMVEITIKCKVWSKISNLLLWFLYMDHLTAL